MKIFITGIEGFIGKSIIEKVCGNRTTIIGKSVFSTVWGGANVIFMHL